MLKKEKLRKGDLIGIYLIVAILAGQYNEHLVPYMPPIISFLVGIAGLAAMILFFIEVIAWIVNKLKRKPSKK